MSDSSLGTLGVNIAAYAGQFMAELTRAESSMTKFQRSISRTLTKAGLDTIGLGNAARAMSNELQYVWNNLDKIHGLDPTTIASVQEMKTEVEEFNQTIHRLVAGGMSIFAQFGRSLGLVAGAIATSFQVISIQDIIARPLVAAATFAGVLSTIDDALKADFDAAVKAAHGQNQLADATARAAAAKKGAADILASVSKSNEAFNRSEAAKLESLMREGETVRKEVLTPQEEWADQLVRLNELLKVNAISQDIYNRSMHNADFKLMTEEAKASADALDKIREKIFFGVDGMEAPDFQKIKTAAEEFQGGLNEMWLDISDRGGAAFATLLSSGENVFGSLVDVVNKSVQQMVARLLVINPILNAVSGMFGVSAALPAVWNFGGGKATGGPVEGGTSYLVGEQGPEIFTPRASGAITPNHSLQSGGGNSTYYIDARGADRTGLAQLSETIRKLNGSIEARALGAVMNARQRGAIA